jgi:hypothetical protein
MLDAVPAIDLGSLPQEERAEAFQIMSLLGQLAMSGFDFQHALSLFDHASALEAQLETLAMQTFGQTEDMEQWRSRLETRRQISEKEREFGAWKRIAARDAAMTIYHFSITLEAIQFGKNSALGAKVDHSLIRRSRKEFKEYFPNAKTMRDAVGHYA